MDEKTDENISSTLPLADNEKQLFEQTHQIIISRQLFLNPGFSRSSYIKLALINKNKVARLLRQYAGSNLNGYINAMRLDYAMTLLCERPDAPIKAIAADSGFKSVRTFYRLFFEKTGMTPLEYKERKSEV